MVLPIIFGLMLQLGSSGDSGRSVLEFLSDDSAGTTKTEKSMAMQLHGLADVELTVETTVRGTTKDDERWDLVFVVRKGSVEKVIPHSIEATILKKWAHDRGNLFTNDGVLHSTASIQKLGLAANFDLARLLREVAQVRLEIEEWVG